MTSAPAKTALLTDALARGRITLAELAGIDGVELDAIYDLACGRLAAGRDADAEVLLTGLLALFPFAASYWVAYGIAAQRRGTLERARLAYDVAATLAPDDLEARCHRGEVTLTLGDAAGACLDLESASRSLEPSLAARAAALLALCGGHAEARAPDGKASAGTAADTAAGVASRRSHRGSPSSHETTDVFVLVDSRPLPLADSPLALTRLPTEITDLYVTATRPLRERWHAGEEITRTNARRDERAAPPSPRDGSSVTNTAIIPGRRPPAPMPQDGKSSVTSTALIARPAPAEAARAASKSVTSTSVVPGRRQRPHVGAKERTEITHTAVVRRRAGLGLDEE